VASDRYRRLQDGHRLICCGNRSASSPARNTANGQPMQAVVARLELKDMIAVAAYAGSREP
jgi:hypothetical protein